MSFRKSSVLLQNHDRQNHDRSFKRAFTLSDDVVVNGADMKDGILTIEMERIIPDHKKARTITIK